MRTIAAKGGDMREFLFAAVGLFWGVLLATMPAALTDPPAKPVPGWATNCELEEIIDGDTIDVRVSRVIRVRLKDCWAPEKRNAGGPESTENLRQLLADGQLTMLIPSDGDEVKDILTFGRALGWIWSTADADTPVNELQVIQGHATREKVR
jgi:endonuclease YncB( thermonuclease family)